MASTKGPSAYAVELAKKGGTALRKRKQKATVFKSTVGSPYAFEWPALSSEDTACLLAVLGSACKGDTVPRKRGGRRSHRGGQQEQKSAPMEAPAAPSLLLGINRVTRALERQGTDGSLDLQLVIVCKDVRPAVLVEHVPLQCALRQVPVCALSTDDHDSSFRLGKLLGLPTAMAVAVTAAGKSRYGQLLAHCRTRACDVSLPWVTQAHPEQESDRKRAGAALAPLVVEPRQKQRKFARAQEATAQQAGGRNKRAVH